MERILIVFVIFILQACEKGNDMMPDNPMILIREEGGKRYDEMACIVDDKAGIKCFESLGKTCKRERSCTPVESIGASQFFTAQELSDWPNVDLNTNTAFKYYMWQIDWFIHPDEDN